MSDLTEPEAPPETPPPTEPEAPTGEAQGEPDQAPPSASGKPPVIAISVLPFRVEIDAGGVPMPVVEQVLVNALAYIQRELTVSRLQQAIREEARSVRTVAAIPPNLLRGVR